MPGEGWAETPGPDGLQSGRDSPGPQWKLEQQLALMNAQFNRRVLIDLFIWNDDQNSSRHIIYVRAPGPARRGLRGRGGDTGPGSGAVCSGPGLPGPFPGPHLSLWGRTSWSRISVVLRDKEAFGSRAGSLLPGPQGNMCEATPGGLSTEVPCRAWPSTLLWLPQSCPPGPAQPPCHSELV